MQFRQEMEVLKAQFQNKEISYNELKLKAKPLIKQFNNKAVELAEKYGVKPKRFSLSAFMR